MAVRIHGLSKTYFPISPGRARWRALLGLGSPPPPTGTVALAPLTLEIGRGESVGLIGSNGSGKSTLLKMLAGVAQPTDGTAEIAGRVSALLELGTGFHPDFTGRENVLHAGLLAGLTRQEIRRLEPEIVEFSELAHAIDDPLKTYSSGMKMRLGFAVAHAVRPDVLLVDEVLAVGDAAFRLKCYDRLREFCRSGGTFILVSHDLSSILKLCHRCLWLEQGVLKSDGPSAEVAEAYQETVMAAEDARLEAAAVQSEGALALALHAPGGPPRHQFRPGDPLEVSVWVTLAESTGKVRVRLFARRRDHLCLLDLTSPERDLSRGRHIFTASLGRHRLGPGELYWSAVLERDGQPIATLADPVPMGIVARPNDVLERGALRHEAVWRRVVSGVEGVET
jgi:ABC-type polysaccharide/polyol phosphate transport system ATPase subunit